MGNLCLRRDNPKVVNQMVLKLLCSDSKCSEIPLEVTITPKLDTARNITEAEFSHEREPKKTVSYKWFERLPYIRVANY